MSRERQRIVLAALLHDIGKFWERADEHYSSSEVIKNEFPNKEYTHTVPVYPNGSPRYVHALWTQAFIHQFKLGLHLGLDESDDVNLANLSARHHKPANHLEGIISLADKWSSSIDRPEEEENNAHYRLRKSEWGDGFQKKVPLENIFDILNRSDTNYKSHSFPISKLNVLDNHSLFSKYSSAFKNESLSQVYSDHWNAFVDEINTLKKRCNEFDAFYISLNDILRNYTWCIPAATNSRPSNVSLYEHLKTTAAIALCLYDYHQEVNKEILNQDLQSTVRNDDSLLMVCLDLSGIQKFIYDIANKKAAKSLKGRSFYLNLLIQSLVDNILDHPMIQAYATNVIYASGGKAYLLLPNTEKVINALNEVENQIQEYLFQEFQGKLYACLGWLSFTYETFKDSQRIWTNKIQSSNLNSLERKIVCKEDSSVSLDLGDLWRIVSDRASAKKRQKFKNLLINNYDTFFKPTSIDFTQEKCAVTGERGKLKDLNDRNDPDNSINVLESVYVQAKIGEKLKDGNFIIRYKKAGQGLSYDIQIFEECFGLKGNDTINSLPSAHFETATISSFNRTSHQITTNNIGVKTVFYGGNKRPQINNENKTFEDLAITDGGEATKLAILRMDVDNLGQIFIKGFNENVQKKSFAAYSTLSFLLEAFFSGYINQIHQGNDLFKENIQILYSGGDDLFAVGRWDAIIEFADTIRSEFDKFTNRQDITISGGIAIVGAKYPIMKSADLAGELEHEAKTFNNNAKNAINFFGETVSWDKEFPFVKEMKDRFIHYGSVINRSLLHNIQKYKIIKDNGIKSGKGDLSYIWNAAYTLARTIENMNGEKHPEEKEFIKSLIKGIMHDSDYGSERYLDLIALAARWAEYLLKIKN